MSAWGEISRLQSEAEQKERERRAADKKFAETMSAWDEGYDLGMRRAAYWDRVDAFGAIRRAAAIARYCDREAGRAFPVNHPQTAEEARLRLLPAKAIRDAIRAAIGSDKS